MTNLAITTALLSWLTKDSALPIYLIIVLPSVLAVLLAALVVYAVYWKKPK